MSMIRLHVLWWSIWHLSCEFFSFWVHCFQKAQYSSDSFDFFISFHWQMCQRWDMRKKVKWKKKGQARDCRALKFKSLSEQVGLLAVRRTLQAFNSILLFLHSLFLLLILRETEILELLVLPTASSALSRSDSRGCRSLLLSTREKVFDLKAPSILLLPWRKIQWTVTSVMKKICVYFMLYCICFVHSSSLFKFIAT